MMLVLQFSCNTLYHLQLFLVELNMMVRVHTRQV